MVGWGDSSVGYGAGEVTMGKRVRISVTAITVSCAAIYFPAVYNLQRYQRPVSLILCLCAVGGLKIVSVGKGVSSGFLLLIHHMTAMM